jgi:tetratricopeptide (TPR) repeat protein
VPLLTFFAAVLLAPGCTAPPQVQEAPARVLDTELPRHLKKMVPAEPVTTVYANYVTADIVIATNGSVESVTILEGNPAHVASATAAFKQWQFLPFLENGAPIRAIMAVGIHVPDELPSPVAALSWTAADLARECTALVNGRDLSKALDVCTKAVEAADQLPPDFILERSGARAWLGHALLMEGRFREALDQYTQELTLGERVLKATDAELSSAHRHVGMASFLLGDLAGADAHLGLATTIMEAAIVALPSEKANYQRRLRDFLTEHARVKRAMGDPVLAAALEKKAAGR